jgi:hypothetical protein
MIHWPGWTRYQGVDTYFDDEKNPPVGNMGVSLLYAESYETAKSSGDGSEAKPVGHAQTHFLLRIKEREIKRDGGTDWRCFQDIAKKE